MLRTTIAALATAVALAGAGVSAQDSVLSSMRATIPGSIHQCENTSLYFFDTSNTRPLDVLFVPLPNSLSTSGVIQVQDALDAGVLQAIDDYETPDAAAQYFVLGIEAGQEFGVYGFLEDGQGKDLSLTRTMMTPLPGATSCLGNVQTTLSGYAAAGATTTSSSSSSATMTSSSAMVTSTSSTTTSVTSTETSTLPTLSSSSSSSSSSSDSASMASESASSAAASDTTGAAVAKAKIPGGGALASAATAISALVVGAVSTFLF